MRTWFATDLETVATFWRVLRKDGVTLGFTSHDRDLWFDGVRHLASPGMVPSSIKRTADFEPDSAEVRGALSHETISARDLSEGRFDGAQVRIGVVDWQTRQNQVLYRGSIGAIIEEDGSFTAELQSRKTELLRDPVPRTSPTCRAIFAGPGCGLNPALFSHRLTLVSLDPDTNSIVVDGMADPAMLVGGTVRWSDGPQAGIAMTVMALGVDEALVLDTPLDPAIPVETMLVAREGCDRTLTTCSERFANVANFRGEPFLPGNDRIARYPSPQQ